MPDFLNKWIDGLNRTRKSTFDRLSALLGVSELTEETWEELEGILVQADLGIETVEPLMQTLRDKAGFEMIARADQLSNLLRAELLKRLDPPPPIALDAYKPAVVLLVGVNGSGKTTTAAKLGKRFALQGKQVLLAAADTYRAAAVDQLQVWGERLNLPPGFPPGWSPFPTGSGASTCCGRRARRCTRRASTRPARSSTSPTWRA